LSSISSNSSSEGNACDGEHLICANFDGSNELPTNWSTSNPTRVAISSEYAFSGANSVKVTGTGGGYNANYLIHNLSGIVDLNKSMFGRMMIRLSSENSLGGDFTFIQAEGVARSASGAPPGTTVMYRGRLDGRSDHFMANYDTWIDNGSGGNAWPTYCWDHPNSVNPPPQQYLLPKDQWACVQWEFDGDANSLRFWLNDNELTEIQVNNTGDECTFSTQNDVWWGPENFTDIRLGIEQYDESDLARTLYIDDIAIDDRFVSCPDSTPPTSSSSSSLVSSSFSSSSSSGGVTPILSSGPIANGLCAANTGLGSGSAAYGNGCLGDNPCAYVVLHDGSAIRVHQGTTSVLRYSDNSPINDAIAISNGSYSNNFCVARVNGAMHCGTGGSANVTAAYTPASSAKAIVALSSNNIGGSVCAQLADGTVSCGNSGGLSPQNIGDANTIVHLSCFRNDACCGVTSEGNIQCWGEREEELNNTPTQGPNARALLVAGSDRNQCAVYDDAKSYCWGATAIGATGGSPQQDNPIVPVPLTDPVAGVAGGQFHTCWVHTDGSVSCSGDGGTANGAGGGAETPTKIRDINGVPLSNIIAINGGRAAACGAASNGDLYCWGDPGGQLEKAVKINLNGKRVRMPAECMN
jgi:hypothetical protein